jgi:hypothetical protein
MYLTKKVINQFYFPIILMVFLLASCAEEKRTFVKNAPVNKPFIFSTKITLTGNLTKDEKKHLTTDLENYWDDSLRVPEIQKFGILYTIKNPPVFDSINVLRTKKSMNNYLNSQGYYYAGFKDSIPKFDTIKGRLGLFNSIFYPHKIVNDQIRASVFMTIATGKNITIDTASYSFLDSNMQKIAEQNINKSNIKTGTAYSKQNISTELDRLTTLYRNNGYYNFTRDDIYALVDSINAKLLHLTLDPFEQIKLLDAASKERKTNPKWNVAINQRPFKDSSKIQQFYVGKFYFYPETKITDNPDSLIKRTDFKEEVRRISTMKYFEKKFASKPLREHNYLKRATLFDESKYYKTINSLSKIGAWQQVDARIIQRDKDSLDIHYFLVPAIKQNYSIDLEGSRNTGDFTTGSLFGISTNFTYRNRNVWKQAIQSITSFRVSTELNLTPSYDTLQGGLLQSFQVALSHTYIFPKLIQPFKSWRYLNKLDNKRTLFNIGINYYDRKLYYHLKSFVTSWGYEWNKGPNSWSWVFKPLNIELYKIDTLDQFTNLINTNPYLRNSFRDGNVIGSSIEVSKTMVSKNNPDNSHKLRFYAEESATLLSLIKSLNNNFFNYAKVETEYIFRHKQKKAEWSTRLFAGIAIPKAGQSIPAFKQYFLGGPNSMRAWNFRQLGLGSSVANDTLKGGYTDRFGDLALEGNIEYRFPIFSFSSVKISSALFADIGNIWNLTYDAQNPNAEFSLARLGRDIAVGAGTGIRLDFNYFLLRFDLGYKLKDPARQYNNGWSDINHLTWTDLRSNGVRLNNYAFQFGINLPF